MTRRALLLLAAAVACSTDEEPTALPTGAWGGEHVSMTVGASAAAVEFDCAHGTIEGPLLVSDGAFDRAGVYVREHGGPVREGEPEDSHPAVYAGRLQPDSSLSLTVRLTDTATEIGPFSLALGRQPRLFKCQ